MFRIQSHRTASSENQTQRSADEIEARAARDHKFYAEQEATLKERTKSEREALLSVR